MKTALVLFALLMGWLLLSQGIAWMLTPSKDEDTVLETWFAVFLLPVALAIIVLTWMEDKAKKRLQWKM